jgi:hypothetical protein
MFVGQEDDGNKRASEAALILILCKDEPSLSRREREWIFEWMRQSRENVACLFEMIDIAQLLDRRKLADRAARLSSPPPHPAGFALGRPSRKGKCALSRLREETKQRAQRACG